MARTHTAFRLPTAEIRALDALAEKLSAAQLEGGVTRTDVVRRCYLAALREHGIDPRSFESTGQTPDGTSEQG